LVLVGDDGAGVVVVGDMGVGTGGIGVGVVGYKVVLDALVEGLSSSGCSVLLLLSFVRKTTTSPTTKPTVQTAMKSRIYGRNRFRNVVFCEF
jgi:hypothetical protein